MGLGRTVTFLTGRQWSPNVNCRSGRETVGQPSANNTLMALICDPPCRTKWRYLGTYINWRRRQQKAIELLGASLINRPELHTHTARRGTIIFLTGFISTLLLADVLHFGARNESLTLQK